MDDSAYKGNTKRQEPIADKAANIVILFTRSQMCELCEIIKHKKERSHSSKQPGIISIA